MKNVAKVCYSAYRQGHRPSRATLIFCLLAGPLFAVATCQVEAATFYCDPCNGNTQTGDGSAAKPWGTLQSAVTAKKLGEYYTTYHSDYVQPGDTVKLRTGFHGKFAIYKFTPSDYITIEADTGAVPDVNSVSIKDSNYWHLKGWRISPSFSPGYYSGSGMTGSKVVGTNEHIYFCTKSHTSDANNRPLTGVNYSTYWRRVGDDSVPATVWQSGVSYTYCYENTIVGISANGSNNYITIEDCNIFTEPDSSSWTPNQWYFCAWHGVTATHTNNSIFRHNVIRNTGAPLTFLVHDNRIENNTIDGFFVDAILPSGPNTIIQDNRIVNVYDSNDTSVHSDAIQFGIGDDLTNVIIRRNYICSRTNPNRTNDRGLQGIYCVHNLINGLIENNVVIASSGGYYGIEVNGDSNNSKILNNTILAPFGLSSHPAIKLTSATCSNILIRNNICGYINANGTNITTDHNFNISNYNPLIEFVDYVNGNVHLAANSHFIDTGSSSDAPNEDLARNSRPQGQGYDVGAYEYGTTDSNNHAPVLQESGNKSVNENALLTFTVTATDADNDTITYSATGLPTGATFSGQTFSWTPGYDQAGTYNVNFVASDEHGAQSSPQTIVITVNNVNRPPVLAAIGNKAVNENALLTFTVSATDADNDTITYSATGLPTGATFSGQTFNWTPGYDQAGTYTYNVTFIARDEHGAQSSPQTVVITVNNVNRPPVLAAIGNKSVSENSALSFSVSATDPDGDAITYSVDVLPSGATFAGQSFNWQPDSTQVGSQPVTFTASDGELQDSETITITVLSTDTLPPVVTNCSPAAGSIQIPLNSLIVLHITDVGKGVDANSVIIKVDGNVIYSGDTLNYSSVYGNCRRSGAKADYTYVYQSNEMFDFDQPVTVTVDAADLAGKMSQQSYSFRTEMRSFGQNKKVSLGSDTLSKSAPATVRDSAGNIWAAWHAGPAGSRDIYIGKLAAGADNFGGSVRLTQNTADQCNPAIAVDSVGKLYVVWQDNRTGTWDIYVSTSSGGATWSTERKVTDSNDNQINPAIAVDTSNRAYIVWQDDRNKNQDIYIAASSNDFATETVSQITSNSTDQTEPAVAVDSSNTVYVVWTDARNGSSDIYGAASNNGPWTNVPIVVSNAGHQSSSPAIAAGPEGSILHLLWVDDRSGNQDIYYATSNGLPSSPLSDSSIISIIDDASGANQLAPVIITNGSSKVFACWQDRRNVTVNGGDTDLYFAELTSNSKTNILVGDDGTNLNQSEPAIGIGEYGHPYLVWTDDRSTITEIYYAASTFVEPVTLKAKDVSASLGATVGTEPATGVDDVSVVVPPGACSCDAKITISKIKNPEAFAAQCLGSYDFGPSGMQFSQPVTVTIPYAVSSSGTSALAYWYNSLTGALSQQGITNVENIQISSTLYALRFKTTHFTPFYLLLAEVAGGAVAGSSSGGGGGGGCSISAGGEANIAEFFLPYVGLTIVMVILKLRDRRNQKTRGITESIHPS